jgi:hypothetical protein
MLSMWLGVAAACGGLAQVKATPNPVGERFQVVSGVLQGREVRGDPRAGLEPPPGPWCPDCPPPRGGIVEYPTPGFDASMMRTTSPPSLPPARGTYADRAPGDFGVWRSVAVPIQAPFLSSTAEPSVAGLGDLLFVSGNRFAALSKNAGLNWGFVNPADNFPADGFTDFPAPNSGSFCCDQVVYADRDRAILVWLLQYHHVPSNVHRLAVATNEGNLRGNVWRTYDITPALLGFSGASDWLDFPDLSVTHGYLWYSTNVFVNNAPLTSTSVVARFNLNQLATGNPTVLFDRTTLNRPGPRLTHGATFTMYWAVHENTSSLRVYEWQDVSTTGGVAVTVGHTPYATGSFTANTDSGTNFAGNCDSRLIGAFVADGELGFMWNIRQGGTFPYPYSTVKRYNEAGYGLRSEEDIWNNSVAWLYPSVHPSISDDLGGTIVIGGGATEPTTVAWIADGYNGRVMAPLESAHLNFVGTHGPANNRWGDYYATRPNWRYGNTWNATGFVLQGGPNPANTVPYVSWFGREQHRPPADLELAEARVSRGTYLTGGRVRIPYVVSNIGAGVSTGFTLTARLSLDDVFTGADPVLGVINRPALANNATDAGDADFIMPDLPQGEYYVRLEVSGGSDSIPTNNAMTLADRVFSAPADNDDCFGALPVRDGHYFFDTCAATASGPDEPACGPGVLGKDRWFIVDALAGTVRLETCRAGVPTFDSFIAVYPDLCPVAPGAASLCNDDSCGPNGLLSAVTLVSPQGGTYLVRVGGVNGSCGQGDLWVQSYCDVDYNGDGNADQDDVGALIRAIAGGDPAALPPDFNRDGNVDQDDISALIRALAGGGCP